MSLAEKLRMQFRAWKYRYRLDRAEVRFVIEQLRPGDLAVDIGAHKGAYSFWMCRAVGQSGQVFAFEPQADLAAYLQRVKLLFQLDNLTVENCAVSSASGSASLKVPGDGPDPGATMETGLILRQHQSRPVRTVTLDSYFETSSKPIALIKCDVEGHELAVFEGASTVLRRDMPALIFECEERHHRKYSNREVFRYLTDLGYEGFFFAQNRRVPVGEFNVITHGNPEGENYINNFVFLRPGG